MRKIIAISLAALCMVLLFAGCQRPYTTEQPGGQSADPTESVAPESVAPEPSSGAPEPTDTPEPAPGSYTYEILASLHEGMPEYRFVATGMATDEDEWSYGYVTGLNVYDENGLTILSADFTDVLNDERGNAIYREMIDTMGLHVVDVNFDGYRDVIILNTFAGVHGNSWYDCWLWDAETSSFTYCESFAGICNPAIDLDRQCIYSSGGSGASVQYSEIYKYIDGAFIVSNTLLFEWLNENSVSSFRVTEERRINGDMEIVKDIIVPDEQEEAEMDYYNNDELWQLDSPRWYMLGGHHADEWLGGIS